MIETREVQVVIVATVQVPCESPLPDAQAVLTDRVGRGLRDIGYVPKFTVQLEEA